MAETASGTRQSLARLVLVPGLISLAVTILRLIGELNHWSPRFFNPAPGGGGAIVGISWLPLIFGPYFALELAGADEGPKCAGKAIAYTILGVAVFFLGGFLGFGPRPNFPGKDAVGYLLMAAGGVLVLPGWPALFKTLLAYGYVARIPVAIVAFFAIRGAWGTHYDAMPPAYRGSMSSWALYFHEAFLPQMVFWVAYTIIVGAIVGTVVTAIAHRSKRAPLHITGGQG